MDRRIIAAVLTVLLFASVAWGRMGLIVIGGTPASSSGDICSSSGLLLSWHSENLDLSLDGGCSELGDSTFSIGAGSPSLTNTDKSEGSHSVSAARNSRYSADISQNAPTSAGTIYFDFKIPIADNYATYVRLYGNADNYIGVSILGADGAIDIQNGSEGNNSGWSVVKADTNITVSNNYWYRVKYQYNVNGSTKQRIDVWQLDGSSPRQTTGAAVSASSTTSITALTTLVSVDVGWPAGGTSSSSYALVDNIKIYSTTDI